MREKIIRVILTALVLSNGYLFVKFIGIENSLRNVADVTAAHNGKMQYLDKVVEIVENCLEFNTLGECKARYPQYAEQFR